MTLLTELFLTFAKIGLFTFGGGYAMISVIEHDCVERKHWISHDDMMNITVIAESTPGPIAINCATFVGYRQKGLMGAIAATVGIVLPSFLVIYLIAMLLDHFLDVSVVANAFRGIKLAVGILVLDAAVKMIKKMRKKPTACVIMVCAAVLMLMINLFSWNVSSIGVMLLAGVIGVILYAIRTGAGKERG